MKLDYEAAGIRLRFESGYQLKQSGFAPLFVCSRGEPDFVISVSLAPAIDTSGKVIYETDTSLCVERDGETRLLSKDLSCGEYYFDVGVAGKVRSGILRADHAEPCADAYFLWRVTDLSGILTSRGRLPLHCSAVDVGGRALLFCGPSGIGKSTQAGLWRSLEGAEIINGDRAALYFDECGDRPLAASLPVAGTSGICVNRTLPIAAAVILGQAKENACRRLGPIEAFAGLMNNSAFEKDSREQLDAVSALCAKAAGKVPVFRLDCTPDAGAIAALKQELRGMI